MKITDFNTLKKFSPQLDAELKQVFAKYGLTFHDRSARISPGILTYNITLKTGSREEQEAIAKRKWEASAPYYGLPVDAYGKHFNHQGRRYRVVGIDTRKPKKSLVVERDDGETCYGTPNLIRGAKLFSMEVPA